MDVPTPLLIGILRPKLNDPTLWYDWRTVLYFEDFTLFDL